ncbi:MAG TPA: hypothetical protein VK811_03500 [Candidatus Acidoferrum sp.]|nr:hypothetical protein [Candidatus Acidoferrum sp.]
MLLRLGKVLVVFALVSTLSAHWALLQTVAWTTMLAGNLQSGSLHDAVAKTFDGLHPCCLCKAIANAKNSEQKNQLTSQDLKLDFLPVHDSLALIAPSRLELFPRKDSSGESVSEKPPTPPPRPFFI